MWSCCGLPGYQTRKGAKPSAAQLAGAIARQTHSSTSSRRDDTNAWGCKLAKRHVTRTVRHVPHFLQKIKHEKEMGKTQQDDGFVGDLQDIDSYFFHFAQLPKGREMEFLNLSLDRAFSRADHLDRLLL